MKLLLEYLISSPWRVRDTHLLRQCVSHHDVVCIVGLLAHVIRDVRRLRRPWFVFETPKIGFYVIQIDLELNLMGKSNVGFGELLQPRISRAKYHHSEILILF